METAKLKVELPLGKHQVFLLRSIGARSEIQMKSTVHARKLELHDMTKILDKEGKTR